MVVAIDSVDLQDSVANPTITKDLTPVGTPKGVIVYVTSDTTTDEVVSASYGSVAMTEVTGSPVSQAGDPMITHAFYLLSGIPTGTQARVVTVNAATSKRIVTIFLTADGDTELVDSDTISSASVANPSVTLSLGGKTCFVCIGFCSGQNAVGSISPFAGWSDRGERDLGSVTTATYTYDTISNVDVAAGWTQATEIAAAIALAIADTVAGSLARPVFRHLGRPNVDFFNRAPVFG